MLRRILYGLLALGLLVLGTVAFMARHSFRRESEPAWRGWSVQALENDTLVLERWLAARGARVSRAGGRISPEGLPPGGVLILLRLDPVPLDEAQAKALLAWVHEGGFLLVDGSAAPDNNGDGTKALFRLLGAELVDLETKADHTRFHTDRWEDVDETLALHRNPRWRIKVDPTAWDFLMGGDQGEVLVLRPEGKGKVALASDLGFLFNEAFPELDHAVWLDRVLGTTSGTPVVVWSKPAEAALLGWLWSRAWPFLVACASLVGVWLWGGFQRFGPWLPASVPGRRSLREHLEAAGRFMWGQGGQEGLVVVARESVLRLASCRHPGFRALTQAQRLRFLQETTGLPEADIAMGLDDRPGAGSEVLARRLQVCLLLRHRLSARG